MRIVLLGQPITKKNSQRIITVRGHPVIIPSAQYKAYEAACLEQIRYMYHMEPISGRVNLQCLYYMQTRRLVDLVNLLEGTQDILVNACVLSDDNNEIVFGVDGSRVLYDKENPRVEITITAEGEEENVQEKTV